MNKSLWVPLLFLSGMLACGTEDVDEIEPPEMRECNRETVEDWEAVNTLEWTASLPEQSRFTNFEELLESMTGEYDVAHESAHGTLKISRGDEKPYETFDSINCQRLLNIPVHLELNQDENSWAETVHLLVAFEHLGYVTDRDVPPPMIQNPAFGWAGVDGFDDLGELKKFPLVDATTQTPKLKSNEQFLELTVTVSIFPAERVSLEVKVQALVTGSEGATMYASKPWFTIEGDLKD